MSTASRRRTRQRLAEIALGLKSENLDATTSGSDLDEGDGMSRTFYDNLPSKDIKSRVEKPLGSPMQTEDIDRCECEDCGWHPEGCSHPASFRVRRIEHVVNVCADCLLPTDTHMMGD